MEFIYGQEGFLINQEVNKLIKQYDIEPIIYSNGEPLDNILLDASTASMFSDKKLIVIKNHPAFEKEMDTSYFTEGIENNDDVKLIFSYEAEKLDKKISLIKFLLAKAKCTEFKSLDTKNVIPAIKRIVEEKGGSIDNNALIQLANKLPEDLRIIMNEVEKLLLESSHITMSMVNTSIGEYLKDDFFALSNALTARDPIGIMNAYKKKKAASEDATYIISQISSTLSLALTVSSYREQGLSNSDISDKLNIHIFRIKKASELISSSSGNNINELVKSLAQLDADIKMGKIDPEHGIEVYLLKLIK